MVNPEDKSGASELPDKSSLPVGQLEEKSGATPIPHSTTRPDELLRHDISDEELEMLSSSRRDGLLEAIWGFSGIGAGSLIPSAVAIYESFIKTQESVPPLNFIGLLQILLCGSTLLIVAVLLVLRSKRGSSARDLVSEIRNRQRVS